MDRNLPGDFIDEVRNSLDIVDLVTEHLQLRKAGRNYIGLCPFHQEKTPSFSVNREKQFFYCFGCGEGGNIFGFVMKMEGLSFPDAVRRLATRAGLRFPEKDPGYNEERHKKLLAAVKLAARFYHRQLVDFPAGRPALSYLEKRGISRETIKRFGLGFAPDQWDSLKSALAGRFAERELVEAGLLVESDRKQVYDRFRGRVIFPIFNLRGEPVAFGGRILEQGQPKYLNSPETTLFDKSKNLYGLNLARDSIRREKRAVLFEGYMDVIIAHQAGITNAVATLGTSLAEAQAKLLRNQAEEVIIVYDSDTPGQAAAWRGLQILRQAGCLVKAGRLPAGMDPDDFIRRRGAEAFRREVLEGALLLVDYQLARLAESHNLSKTEDRIRFTQKAVEVLSAITSEVEREDYLNKAASLLAVGTDLLRAELKKARQVQQPKAGAVAKTGSPAARTGLPETAALQVLAVSAQKPELAAKYLAEIEREDFPSELWPVYYQAVEGNLCAARLFDMLPDEYRRPFGGLLFEGLEENLAEKAIEDCIKRLKRVRIAARRKELEVQMAKLDPALAKGEINELSREWLELRRLEESLNKPREGGKGVG
jgi:DNA primase